MTRKKLKASTKNFPILIFKSIEKIAKESISNDVNSYHLFKSLSSIVANKNAANKAKSKQNFLNKPKIVNDELVETLF